MNINEIKDHIEKRKSYKTGQLPADIVEAIKNTKMDPKYNYLDELYPESEWYEEETVNEHSVEHLNDRIVQQSIDFFGMPVCVEIVKGGVKHSKSKEGKPWQRKMKCDYGYFEGVTAGDGEFLDCYIWRDYANPNNQVYVIKQMTPDGKEFDESKVMLGCASEQMAKDVYIAHCHTNKCFGDITPYTIEEFRNTIQKND